MEAFTQLPDAERRLYCEQAAARLNLPAASIEKDFWVCWTLRVLFGLPDWGSRLTFKGGTSLSKGWQLIERFSEDIDVVIDRELFGFGGTKSPQHARSSNQRKKRLEALKAVCQQRIQQELLPALRNAVIHALPLGATGTIELASVEEDPEQQSLLFLYPTIFAGSAAYVRPVVRIELGARSDTEPSDSPIIRPYLADAFPDVITNAAFGVRAVAPRRTFWEKAFLLHEETFRPPDRPRNRPLARHYYDLWSLVMKGVAAEAVADAGLFERVAEHRQVFFRLNWVDYTTLRPGALRLVPLERQLPEWERDYNAMRGEMFFGAVPTFADVLRVVSEFERHFNGVAAELR